MKRKVIVAALVGLPLIGYVIYKEWKAKSTAEKYICPKDIPDEPVGGWRMTQVELQGSSSVGATEVTDHPWNLVTTAPMMPQWRQKIVADKERFLRESRERNQSIETGPFDPQGDIVSTPEGWERTRLPLLQRPSDLGEDFNEQQKIHLPGFGSSTLKDKVVEDENVAEDKSWSEGEFLKWKIDPKSANSNFEELLIKTGFIFHLGDVEPIAPMGKQYKKIVRRASSLSKKDPDIVLKFSGKTYGIGARGTAVDDHRVYNADDIAKLVEKIKPENKKK